MAKIKKQNGTIEIPDNFKEKEVEFITARTPNQKELIRTINQNDLVFALGPAGVGKTFLSTAIAIEHLYKNKTERIVLTRPAVSVMGPSLGFLPGDVFEKMAVYLQPLLESLNKVVSQDKLKEWTKEGKITTTSVGFMRGLSYENCIVVIDESQNLLMTEMLMLITRLGIGGKMIFCGDIQQSDLPLPYQGALELFSEKLAGIDGVGTVTLTDEDIQRHRLVKTVLNKMKGLTTKDLDKFKPRELTDFMRASTY